MVKMYYPVKKFFIIFCISFFSLKSTAQVNFTSSNLPIIIIDTHGQIIPDEPKITADMGVIDNGEGNTNFVTDNFNVYSGKIGIEIRGHSSQMFPKKQYGIELRDEYGNSVNSELLGMPSESDFVLNASYTDKTFLRNVLAYKFGNETGRYASRTKFCEVVINNEYMGLYILQEKIKRDKNRVNIKKLEEADTTGNDLTGGYILKIDRIDPGDKYFDSVFPSVYPKIPSKPAPISYIHVYPNSNNILPVQQNYIRDFINQFETSLSKSTFNNPFLGYYDFVDMDAMVDYFLVSEFVKSVDAYRLSMFLHKYRDSEGGRLVFGPLWDYDIAFGLADYGYGWMSSDWVADAKPYEGIWSIPFWVTKIFHDPVFFNMLAKRWSELKSTVFNLTKIINDIDQTVLKINPAVNRNFNRWQILGTYQWPEYYVGQTYAEEVLWLKGWIIRRYNWIDSSLPSDYSSVDWQDVDFSQISFKSGVSVKLPISLFAANLKNISSFEYQCQDPNINFVVDGDSVIITPTLIGEYVFKFLGKNNNQTVALSPEYKINVLTSVDVDTKIPYKYDLFQNYPNPFNPATQITFSIEKPQYVSLKVYDLLGNEIAVLVDDYKEAGIFKIHFPTLGLVIPSGIYFYTLQTNNIFITKKMILIK